MTRQLAFSLSVLILTCPGPVLMGAETSIALVTADPSSVRLSGPRAVYSLLISGKTADGRWVDLTTEARYQAMNPKVATVTNGVLRAVADGSTTVTVEAAGRTLMVPVTVEGI